MKYIHSIFLTAILTCASTSASGKELIQDFRGDSNFVTPTFTVESPWIIDWQLFGDYDQLLALDVQLLDAETGLVIGRVLHRKVKGNGVRLFRQSGSYRLRVSATLARWVIRVEQLTDEEAELYTPR